MWENKPELRLHCKWIWSLKLYILFLGGDRWWPGRHCLHDKHDYRPNSGWDSHIRYANRFIWFWYIFTSTCTTCLVSKHQKWATNYWLLTPFLNVQSSIFAIPSACALWEWAMVSTDVTKLDSEQLRISAVPLFSPRRYNLLSSHHDGSVQGDGSGGIIGQNWPLHRRSLWVQGCQRQVPNGTSPSLSRDYPPVFNFTSV